MSECEKPRLCKVLGVDVGEIFTFGSLPCKVNSDGWMYKNPLNNGWVLAEGSNVCAAINHPKDIRRKPRWTKEDVEFVKAIRLIYPTVRYIEREPYEVGGQFVLYFNDGNVWRMTSEARCCPSLKAGEVASLDEILAAEDDIDDSGGVD